MKMANMCVRTAQRFYNLSQIRINKHVIISAQKKRFWSSTGTPNSNAAQTSEKEVDNKDTEVSPAEIKLQEEKLKLEEDLKSFKDKYLRSLAETENVRQRMTKQIEDAKNFGIQGFCKDLLDVADNLNLAVDNVPKEEIKVNPQLKTLFEGLTMTETQLQKVFSKHGLVKINPEIGEKFDHFIHEAMFQVPSQNKESDSGVAIVNKIGYKLKERTIRPAQVGVFKA